MRVSFVSMAIAVGLVSGCYDVPEPACGFTCGPGLECPNGYTCNTVDRRCHLDGSSPSMLCPGPDGGIDMTPPFVLSSSPGPGETAPVDTTVTAVFSETVVGVDETTFTLRDKSLVQLPGTVAYDPASSTAVFTPTASLPAGRGIVAHLDASIRDLWGNAFEGLDWAFNSDGDGASPLVTSTTPSNAATGVDVNTTIAATFSEDVLNVSMTTFTVFLGSTPVTGGVLYTSFPPTATFTPDAPLAADTTYTAILDGGIVDHANNTLLPYAWTFTTAP